jgi:tetratricopeptide (TPR) repeat protein
MLRYSVGDSPKVGMTIEEVIHGGIGVVYVARWEVGAGEIVVALKSCESAQMRSPERLAIFQNEALVWLSLPDHPNVVEALYFEIDGGLPFITLEYAEGGNLRDRLNHGRIDLADVARIASQVCEGMRFLDEAHRIVHRDLKPENVLFSGDGVAKITDFGLAAAYHLPHSRVAASDTPAGESDARLFAGTAPYMAPEQFKTFHSVDVRADVYSFGVVLYEMLSGRRPFTGRSVPEFAEAHTTAPPPDLPADIPEPIRAIVFACLAKDPSHRFRSFEQLGWRVAEFCRAEGMDTAVAARRSVAELEADLSSTKWNNRGFMFVQLGDLDEAVRCYREGIAKFETEDHRGHTLVTPGVDKQKDAGGAGLANLYTNLGAALMRTGQTAAARRAFEDALVASPDDAVAFMRLGQIELAAGNTEAGLDLLRRSTESEPGNWDLTLKYLRALHTAGNEKDFDEGFSKFLEGKAHDHPFLIGVGCFLDQELGPTYAWQCFDKVLELDPTNSLAWFNTAVLVHRDGYFAEAATFYQNAMSFPGAPPHAHLYLALLMLEMNMDESTAARHLMMYLQLDPTSTEAGLVKAALAGAELGVPLATTLGLINQPAVLRLQS